MSVSAPQNAQTEGLLDGEPHIFHYEQVNHVDGEVRFSWVEGHDISPESVWTHIPFNSILAVTRADGSRDDYHFLYVEDNITTEKTSKASPISFRSHVLTNPPRDLVRDSALSLDGSYWKSHQDRSQSNPTTHVVVSTGSGTGLAESFWQACLRPLLDYLGSTDGTTYKCHVTTSETSTSELTRDVFFPRAQQGITQTILLLSGDGGILDIANTLLACERGRDYKKPNIAILPLGTGNALAHSSGITLDNTLGLRTWLKGSPKEFPLFAATFSSGARILFDEARQERPLHNFNGVPTAHGAVVCSWGLHAGLVADSDTVEYRKFGAGRFKMAAKEAFFPEDGSPPHAYQGKVSMLRPGRTEWETIRDGAHAYILVTPVSQLEKGFTISPHAKPLEGKLRLVQFGPVRGEEAMEIMGKAYQGGQHVNDERVGYDEIEALQIEFNEADPRWRRVCIDGQIIRTEEGGRVEVRAGQKGVVDLIVQ